MGRLPVFISFSRVSPRAATLSAELYEAWQDGPLLPFRDAESVQPDADWQAWIDEALRTCGAAIILLAPEIVGQGGGAPAWWLLYEASILSFRKRLDPDFRLITVALEGLDPAALAANPAFQPLTLSDRQLRFDTPTLAQRIVTDLAPLASSWADPDPEVLREQRIATLLRHAEPETLVQAHQHFGLDAPGWALDRNPREVLARQLARALCGLEPKLAALRLKKHLATDLGPGPLLEIIDLVAASWVPASGAADLRRVVQPERRTEGEPPLAAVAAPVAMVPTVELYASRAAGRRGTWTVTSVDSATAGEFQLTAAADDEARYRAIEAQVREGLEDQGYEDEADFAWGERPWLVAVPAGVLQPAELARLRADFPSCTFFLYDPAVDQAWGEPELRVLPAPVDPAEATFHERLGKALALLPT